MRPDSWHWKLARLVPIKERRLVFTGQFLRIDFPLQFHESMQQRLGPGRAAGNIDIDWNVTVDAFRDVSLLEWRSAKSAQAPIEIT